MSAYFTHSNHLPCPECGASVKSGEADTHACEPERALDYQMFQLRDEVAGFEGALDEYLDSPQGQFARWLAEHERRAD